MLSDLGATGSGLRPSKATDEPSFQREQQLRTYVLSVSVGKGRDPEERLPLCFLHVGFSPDEGALQRQGPAASCQEPNKVPGVS